MSAAGSGGGIYEETMAVFVGRERPHEPLTTTEVADELDCARRTAYKRLRRLVERGTVETKKVGARGRVWWVSPTRIGKSGETDLDATDDQEPSETLESTAPTDAPGGRSGPPARRLESLGANSADHAIFTLDATGHVTSWNADAEETNGCETDTILGEHVSTFYTAADRESGVPERDLRAAAERGRTEAEGWRVRADGSRFWATSTLIAIAGASGEVEGYVMALRGVPERVGRDRTVEESERRYRTLAEHFPNGSVAMFDHDLRYTLVAGQIYEEHDIDPSVFEGARVGERHSSDEVGALLETSYRAALDGETSRLEFEWHGRTMDAWTLPLSDEDGEVFAGMAMSQDVTDRVERKRALERYRTIVETVDDGVYVLDDECKFALANDAYVEMTGYDRETLLGSHCSLVVGDEVPAAVAERSMQLGDGENGSITEIEVQRAGGDRLPTESNVTAIASGDEYLGTVGVVRDVTAHRRYEETLRALHRSFRRLLGAETYEAVSEVVVDAAAEVLDLPGAVVYHHDSATGQLVPAAKSVEAGFMRRTFPPLPADESTITGQAFVDGEPRILDDILSSPNLQVELRVEPDATEMRSGLYFPLAEHGILVAGSRTVGAFDESDRHLVEILATSAQAAYDRVDRESRLRNQRDHLTALDDFNTVVREITDALVRQSTREEIEGIVAERLADSDSYEFAWTSGVDPVSRRIEPHVEAGVDGYLDAVGLSTDPDDVAGPEPVGTAIRTQEMQVARDVLVDPAYESRREYARRYDYRSMATIPIAHEETLYGLLGIHSRRSDAFSEEERAVVGQLGEVVGLAIASVERKRALMSDEMVELEFYAPGVADSYGVEMTGSVSFHRTVPIEDGEFLEYGTTTNETMAQLEALAERITHWKRTSVINEEGGETDFELLLSEPPFVSLIASYGGYVESSDIVDGDYHISVHLPLSVPVREVVDRVRESYPSAQVVSKRQLTQVERVPDHLEAMLSEELTDRQRTALEAAFFSGFYEWPRDSSGADVAMSLGVSGPTFFYHVRNAERKLLERLFDGPSSLPRRSP